MAIATPAWAASLTWDPVSGTSAVQDGSGNWNTTTANWWNGSSNVTWSNATPDTATFGVASGATRGTITLTEGITVGNMTFNDANPTSTYYTITGGTLTLAGTPTISSANSAGGSSQTTTFSTVLAGSGFNLSRGSITINTNNNTFDGPIGFTATDVGINFTSVGNVGGGPSSLGSPSNATNGTISVKEGAALVYWNSTNNSTTDRAIAYTGGDKNNVGSGNWWTFPTIYQRSASGTLTWNGNFSSVNSVAFGLAGENATASNAVFGGVIGDATGVGKTTKLFKAHGGTWSLTGANTYEGGTDLIQGELRVGNGGTAGTLGSGTVTIASSGTLAFNRSDAMTVSNVIAGSSGSVKQMGSGLTSLTAANTYTGATTINSGTLQIGGGGTAGSLSTSSAISGSSGGTLAFNRSNSLTQGTHFNSVIGGSIGVAQVGSGSTVLSGVNTYTGATRVTAGVLHVQSGNINGSSGVTVNGSGAEFKYNSATALTKPLTLTQGTLSGTGSISSAGGVSAGTNAILSPGNSPGAQAYTTGLTLTPGGTYVWETNSGTGTKGVNWDLINVTSGGLNLSALSDTGKFTLDLATLTASGSSGPMDNYTAGGTYTWRIFDANALTLPGSFSLPYAGTNITSLFNIVTTKWMNAVPASNDISVKVAADGTGLDLVVVPEPGTLAIAGIGAGLAMWRSLRRRCRTPRHERG